MKKRKLKVVNKIRFATFIIITAMVIITISGLISSNGKVYSSTYDNYIEIEVKNGDTLWKIAKENNPQNQDIRKVVYRIMKINKMNTANIKPGDVIKVPND